MGRSSALPAAMMVPGQPGRNHGPLPAGARRVPGASDFAVASRQRVMEKKRYSLYASRGRARVRRDAPGQSASQPEYPTGRD